MNRQNYPDFKELLAEKSLWDIWIKLRRSIQESRFNKGFILMWAVFVGVHVGFSTLHRSELLTQSRQLIESGLSFGASILGFLIAGFTIFATMNRPEMLLAMASMPHKKSGLTWLKYAYFSLVEVFITYLVFVVAFFMARILIIQGGGMSALLNLTGISDVSKDWLARILFWLLASTWMWTLLKLKSFVFNIYNVVVTGIAWDAAQREVPEHGASGTDEEGDHAGSTP